MPRSNDRLMLESWADFEDGLVASVSDDDGEQKTRGKIVISIAEEQAVDSYNQSFTCTMHLTDEQAIELRDWLSAQLTIKGATP